MLDTVTLQPNLDSLILKLKGNLLNIRAIFNTINIFDIFEGR
jgi:hypothetical protein